MLIIPVLSVGLIQGVVVKWRDFGYVVCVQYTYLTCIGICNNVQMYMLEIVQSYAGTLLVFSVTIIG